MSIAEPEPHELPDDGVVQAWQRLIADCLVCDLLEPAFARRLLMLGTRRFVELGSATGPISQILDPSGVECVAIDLNPPAASFRPMVKADLRALPLRARSFDAVSAVNCLYFLADPVAGIRQAKELLRTGGTFLASAPSRFHDPELSHVLCGWGDASPFDAEDAAALVGQVFENVDAHWWKAPAYLLPDHAAVVDYLVAFKQPHPQEQAAKVRPPITITKSGCDVWGTAP